MREAHFCNFSFFFFFPIFQFTAKFRLRITLFWRIAVLTKPEADAWFLDAV